MRDQEYYRLIISKRAAIKTLLAIADEILPYKSGELSSYGLYDGICTPGRADGGVYNLIEKVRVYKRDAEKYYELRNLLKRVVG